MKSLGWMLIPSLVIYFLWNFVYHTGDGGVDTEKYLVLKTITQEDVANRRIPMCELYEYFVDGYIEFNKIVREDCFKILSNHRNEFVNYKVTLRQVIWLLSQFQPFTGGLGHETRQEGHGSLPKRLGALQPWQCIFPCFHGRCHGVHIWYFQFIHSLPPIMATTRNLPTTSRRTSPVQ